MILAHLLAAPYTKVEESFNLQATHDILRHGIPDPRSPGAGDFLRANYDHFTFPGVVPRSFVGSLVLAGLSKPVIGLTGGLVNEQIIGTWSLSASIDGWLGSHCIARGVLGILNALALMSYASTARKAFGRGVGNWYILLQASQFHVIFYASRTLPNMIAFALSKATPPFAS